MRYWGYYLVMRTDKEAVHLYDAADVLMMTAGTKRFNGIAPGDTMIVYIGDRDILKYDGWLEPGSERFAEVMRLVVLGEATPNSWRSRDERPV